MSDELCLLSATEQARALRAGDVLGARARRCAPGAHRARRSARQRDRHADARARARGGRRGRSPARARRRPAAAARTADRAQGSAGHGGRAHDLRLAVLPRARARAADSLQVERLRAAGAIMRRQDEHARSGARARTPSTRSSAPRATRGTRRARRAARAAAPPSRSPAAWCRSPTAAISAARCATRRPGAACSACARRPGSSPRWPSEAPWLPFAVEGPMARTAADLALLLGAMAGPRSARPALAARRRASTRPRRSRPTARPARGLEPGARRPADRRRGARRPGRRAPVAREIGPRRERGRARSQWRRRGVRDLARVHVGDRPR